MEDINIQIILTCIGYCKRDINDIILKKYTVRTRVGSPSI